MDKFELLEIIPLYVTGKVSNDQKVAIENELPHSQELREELSFWQSAWAAATNVARESAKEHLKSEQIVDYARGVVTDPNQRLNIQQHFQMCDSCREDYEIMRPAYTKVVAPTTPAVIERIHDAIRTRLRLVYLVPSIVTIILCVIIFREAVFGPNEYPLPFALQFQTQGRSPGLSEAPTLTLPKSANVVQLYVPIPHATLQPTEYSLVLSTPDESRVPLVQEQSWLIGSGSFDTARVEIPVSALRRGGKYVLHASIRYSQASEPFEYSYQFNVAPSE